MRGSKVHRPRSTTLLLGLALLTSACGTTVQTSGAGTPAGSGGGPAAAGVELGGAPSGDGLALPTGELTGTGGSPLSGAPDTAGAGLAGAPSSRSQAASVPGTSGRGPVAGAGTPASTKAVGVTASSVFVGVPYSVNSAAANRAVGADGVSGGDQKRVTQVVIDDVNKRGGVAGRQLVPVFHEYDATTTQTADEVGQAACATFTEDNKTFVVLGILSYSMNDCLQKAGVTVIDTSLGISADRDFYRRSPFIFELGAPELDRGMAAQLTSLQRQRYFTPWDSTRGAPAATGTPKVGIMTLETPTFDRMLRRTMLPGLVRLGFDPVVVKLDEPKGNADLGALSAQISSAVLRFRSEGVTHVLITDTRGLLTLLFMNNAESQNYRPRHGGNSNSSFHALGSDELVPREQLNGAVGVGFAPGIDVSEADDPTHGDRANAARKRCIAVLKAQGLDNQGDRNADAIALDICASVWLVKDRLDAVGNGISRDRFAASLERLGSGFQDPAGLGITFGPGRHDGVSSYYDMAWNPSCGCVRYSGMLRRY